MRLRPEQLPADLRRRLHPVYLLCGDEPLQIEEAADAVRTAAKAAGFTEREVLYVDSGFDWNTLTLAAASRSLFGERRILELRLGAATPGQEAGKVLERYARKPPRDAVSLISTGKLPSSASASRWFKAVEGAGAVIQTWPLEGARFLDWLRTRMESRGLQSDEEGIRLIAARTEGNLLAAAQEIDKLYVLQGRGRLDAASILDLVADSARFDVFQLVDAVLQGHAARIDRILKALEKEGMAPAVVLWALAREARLLAQVAVRAERGESLDTALGHLHVWEKRRALLRQALARLPRNAARESIRLCARADRVIKGMENGNAWDSLLCVSLRLAGLDGY